MIYVNFTYKCYKPGLMSCPHECETHDHTWCILPIHHHECQHPNQGLFLCWNNKFSRITCQSLFVDRHHFILHELLLSADSMFDITRCVFVKLSVPLGKIV